MDHQALLEELSELYRTYPKLFIEYMGESVFNRGIPVVRMGEGEKTFLYLGGVSGTDRVSPRILLRWIREYAGLLEGKKRIFHCTADYLFQTRTVYVIPMLNPDGADYSLHGPGRDNVLYDRLLSMNGGREDFGSWRANGRGVDLRYNFSSAFENHRAEWEQKGILGGGPEGFGGESAESEPEIGHLCNFLRYFRPMQMILHLHEGERGLRCYAPKELLGRGEDIEGVFARMTGFGSRGEEDPVAACCAEEQQTMACSLGVGADGGDRGFALYTQLREFLFSVPTML